MATKFKPWIDSPTPGTNIQANNVYATDGQRANGFQPNTVASSIRVNTALRSATLVVAALMDAFLSNSTLDESSSMADVTSALSGVIAGLTSPAFTGQPTSTTPLTSDDSTKIATTAFVKAVLASMTTATVYTGSYTGTGTSGANNPTTVGPIGIETTTPKVFFIAAPLGIYFCGRSAMYRFTSGAFPRDLVASMTDRVVSFYTTTGTASDQFNAEGYTYYWVALC